MSDKKSNKGRIIFYSIVTILLLVGIGTYYLLPSQHAHVHVKLKDLKLGKLELNHLAGSNTTLENIKKKSHVLMVFFTLNCPETKANIKTFNELNKRDDLSVIGYMMSGTSRAKKYAENYNVQFPIAKASKKYMQTFEPNVTPMSFLVRTKDIKVRDKYVGLVIPQKVIAKTKETF